MIRLFSSIAACVLLVAANGLARSKPSFVGTWKLDVSKSNFGSHPAPKSDIVHIFKESPQMGSYRVEMVDNKGKHTSFSWHGPEDGSMHPAMRDGKRVWDESQKEEGDGTLLRHAETSDGTLDARITISDDGKTMTDVVTFTHKDGKETHLKHVFDRVSDSEKTSGKPSA